MGGHSSQTERNMKAHGRPRMRPWILLAGLIVLVAGHSVVLYYVRSYTALSAAVLSGVIILVVIKHLGLLDPVYASFRRRSPHLKPGDRVARDRDQLDNEMDTFLPPIEKPKGPMMKLAYYFTRRQFGKVLTPLKVHSARLPPAFGLFYSKISKLDKKLLLPPETALLIREQVARINVCLFCIDINRSVTIKASMNEAKFDALAQYRTSALFIDAERAVLDYVTELTKDKKVSLDTFARLSRNYSERSICEIVWLVASEHIYNMTNIRLNIHSDMLCDISREKK
jgi:alkylhydroperoxidase family enzyme